MLDERPGGAARAEIHDHLRDARPEGGEDALIQDLYPYADPAPVSYVEPGGATSVRSPVS